MANLDNEIAKLKRPECVIRARAETLGPLFRTGVVNVDQRLNNVGIWLESES
jgi:hypothetical protein